MKKKPTKAASAAKPKKEKIDPRIEEIYEEEVEFMCPVRGKVKQKVKIKRYKPLGEQQNKHVILSTDSIDRLDAEDDGLAIYSDGEDLGLDKKVEE